MTVEQLRVFINAICNKDQTGNALSPDQYNSYLARANEDKFKQEAGYRLKQDGTIFFDASQVSTDALGPFLKETPLTGISGMFTMPADYRHAISSLTADDHIITMLTKQQFDSTKNDPIDFPTDKYPISCMYAGKLRVEPVSVTPINFSYLRKPAIPFWDFTIVNDEPIYAPATSVQLEWDDIFHIDIARFILSYMGVQFNDQFLSQYNQIAATDV